MLIRLLTPERFGELLDVGADVAKRWIRKGIAESAMLSPSENMMRKTALPKRRKELENE